jgi:hypothetical protein
MNIPKKSYTGASYPTRAIRAECLTCMGGSQALVRACLSTRCHLWNHRLGSGKGKLAAIRSHCYECVGSDEASTTGWPDIERCTMPECHLFPLRFGKKPADWRERVG